MNQNEMIGSEGAHRLSEALANNTTITKLSLQVRISLAPILQDPRY